ncbi:MAG TPA: hypothetical protein VE987_10095 [Polyangiaceae bacterium]|nr:hypothetical protein [Polyangiaceae bacterium]
MRHVWSILCTKASVDELTKNISLFDTIEEVQLQRLPGAPPGEPAAVSVQWDLVTLWMRSARDTPERFRQRVSLRAPSGRILLGPETSEVLLLDAVMRARAILRLVGLAIDGPGEHCFVIEYEAEPARWQTAAELPLFVTIL